jgi:hypothetical protein
MYRPISLLVFLLCAGCTVVSPWKLDSIAAGDATFSSARLIYQDPAHDAPFRLEFLRLGTAVNLFLSQTHFPIASPDSSYASVQIQIGEEPPFNEEIPLHEGRMRLHFPEETTLRVTRALADGKKVAILVDGFEETIEPERFSKLYEKLQGSAAFIQNPFKGPME